MLDAPRSAQLEQFLDTVLRKNLDEVLRQRDELFTLAGSCTQLRQLLLCMRRLGSTAAPEPMRTLVDLGHHFYMQAEIKDSSMVMINIGCGVVVPMSHEEAEKFLVKKERAFTEQAQGKTREILRIKFRMRLVMEAISRLQDPQSAASPT